MHHDPVNWSRHAEDPDALWLHVLGRPGGEMEVVPACTPDEASVPTPQVLAQSLSGLCNSCQGLHHHPARHPMLLQVPAKRSMCPPPCYGLKEGRNGSQHLVSQQA